MKRLTKKQSIYNLFAYFCGRLPLKRKITLEFKRIKNLGYCESSKKEHWIVINNKLDYNGTAQTLIHEYAHAIQAEKYGSKDKDHSNNWGKYYAVVYREYLKF